MPYFDPSKLEQVFKPLIDKILSQKKELNPDNEKRLYKKIQDNYDSTVIEKLIQPKPKPDKIILVFLEKEAVSLKTACALVKFTIVSRTSITKSKDTIELLTRLIRRLDASIRFSQVDV
jgi:hypothetical protein